MEMPELLIGLSLIMSPMDMPLDKAAKNCNIEEFAAPLKQWCVDNEILGERELPYWLNGIAAMRQNDLEFLRRRYHELKDLPKLSEGAHFPCKALASEARVFNKNFCSRVRQYEICYPHMGEICREVLMEADRLYQIWDAIEDFQNEYASVDVRRRRMKFVMDKMGMEAFRAGNVPPSVPVWRFVEIP